MSIWHRGMIALVLVGVAIGCGPAGNASMDPVAVLTRQQEAWNRGAIEEFMDGYHRSPDTTFSGSDGTIRGFDAVLARYQKRYPDRAAMGKLAFGKVEVVALSEAAALVTGEWKLEREHDAPGGVFSLVFVLFSDGWKIVHDHTSAFAK